MPGRVQFPGSPIPTVRHLFQVEVIPQCSGALVCEVSKVCQHLASSGSRRRRPARALERRTDFSRSLRSRHACATNLSVTAGRQGGFPSILPIRDLTFEKIQKRKQSHARLQSSRSKPRSYLCDIHSPVKQYLFQLPTGF